MCKETLFQDIENAFSSMLDKFFDDKDEPQELEKLGALTDYEAKDEKEKQ